MKLKYIAYLTHLQHINLTFLQVRFLLPILHSPVEHGFLTQEFQFLNQQQQPGQQLHLLHYLIQQDFMFLLQQEKMDAGPSRVILHILINY